MKRFILLAIMLLPVSLMAQIPQFSKLAEKYDDNEAVTSVNLNKQMMTMFAGENEMIDNLDEIQVILTSDAAIAKKVLDDSKKIVKKIGAEELVSANDDGENFAVYTIKHDGNITNIIVAIDCTATDDESGVVVVSGSIPEERLGEAIQIVNQ